MSGKSVASVSQDYIIEQVKEKYSCTVLKCEGRPVLEFKSEQELHEITEYVQHNFEMELMDVFLRPLRVCSQKSRKLIWGGLSTNPPMLYKAKKCDFTACYSGVERA